MSFKNRLLLLMALDSVIIITSVFIGHYIILSNEQILTNTLILSALSLFIFHHALAYKYRLYNRAWEYASIGELISIFRAVTISILLTAIVQLIVMQHIYIRVLLISWMLHVLLIGGSRFTWRLFRDNYTNSSEKKKRALIIGAGSAGAMVARQLKHNEEGELYPVAFIDDDPQKHNLTVMGLPVLGGKEIIAEKIEELNIDHIIIAIPSLKKQDLNLIFNECKKTNAKTQIIPLLEDLMTGKVSVNDFRDVQVEDLLGREPVKLDSENIEKYIKDEVILVTGAGGSIGSEVCRQISKFAPKEIILLGHGENSIHSIELELKASYGQNITFTTEIADIQDRAKMFSIMKKRLPSVVFHAAAHKHVPLMERNPDEAVKNNVIGTKNVAEAADAANVSTFVMISTDKAVNPTSVMGATKRLAEMIIQNLDSRSNTRFVAVRFGNVLGSRGSVIPYFKEQIKKGGPVTVTHPEMIRYFMTIPEASRLVLQAGALARGGEIFVLDMGEPVKIVDLARNLIKLSGHSEDDIKIVFTGMRPGEKLYEELLNKEEIHSEQVFPKIYIGKSITENTILIDELIATFEDVDPIELRNKLLLLANSKSPSHTLIAAN